MPPVVRSSAAASTTRPLGFWMAVALVMGNMIGSGIFLLPASLAPYGGFSLIGWLVSTIGAVALAFVFARLSKLYPAAGGPYAYTRAAFGDLPGFLVAWGYWIAVWSGLGALAVALVGYLTPFVPGLADPLWAAAAAVGAIWLCVVVNVAAVGAAGWVQIVTTVLKVLPLLLVGVAGVIDVQPAHFSITLTGNQSLAGVVPSVAALTLWAFLGLESATVPADRIVDPDRTIPRATIVGTLLSAAIYILSTVGVMSLLTPGQLAASSAPYADGARAIAGEWAARAVAAGAAISCLGALNGWTLVAGQVPLAAARDRLFPAIFARQGSRRTPAAALVIAGALATALVSLNYTRGLVDLFTFIILLSTLSTLVPYVFSSLSVFLLRDGVGNAPVSTGGALIAALAFVYSLWAMGGAGQEAVYWGFLLLVSGLPVHVFLKRSDRR